MKTPTYSKYDLIGRLERRFRDLSKAISPYNDNSFLITVVTSSEYYKNQLNNLDQQYQLYGKGFWGYGINQISDGNQMFNNLDVADIESLHTANKHYDHATFNLIIFKIEQNNFVFSTFTFNLLNMHWRSDLMNKVSLADIKHVKPKSINQSRFVEIHCNNLSHPISFQVDTYYSHNFNPETISRYFIDEITNAVQEYHQKHPNSLHDLDLLNKSIDRIELQLRVIINSKLTASTKEYEKIVPVHIRKNVDVRLGNWIRDNPGLSADLFKQFEPTLQFFDLMDLKEIIMLKLNWTNFESIFNHKETLSKHFIQLSNLRNAIRHSREKTELLIAEGKSSIIWFSMALKLN